MAKESPRIPATRSVTFAMQDQYNNKGMRPASPASPSSPPPSRSPTPPVFPISISSGKEPSDSSSSDGEMASGDKRGEDLGINQPEHLSMPRNEMSQALEDFLAAPATDAESNMNKHSDKENTPDKRVRFNSNVVQNGSTRGPRQTITQKDERRGASGDDNGIHGYHQTNLQRGRAFDNDDRHHNGNPNTRSPGGSPNVRPQGGSPITRSGTTTRAQTPRAASLRRTTITRAQNSSPDVRIQYDSPRDDVHENSLYSEEDPATSDASARDSSPAVQESFKSITGRQYSLPRNAGSNRNSTAAESATNTKRKRVLSDSPPPTPSEPTFPHGPELKRRLLAAELEKQPKLTNTTYRENIVNSNLRTSNGQFRSNDNPVTDEANAAESTAHDAVAQEVTPASPIANRPHRRREIPTGNPNPFLNHDATTKKLTELKKIVKAHEERAAAYTAEAKTLLQVIKDTHIAEVNIAKRDNVLLKEQARVKTQTHTTITEKIRTAQLAQQTATAEALRWKTRHASREATLKTLTSRTAAAEAAQAAALAQVEPLQSKLCKLQEIGERVHSMLVSRILTMSEQNTKFEALSGAEKVGEAGRECKEMMRNAQELLVWGWERMEGDYRLLTENGAFWRGTDGGGDGYGRGDEKVEEGVGEDGGMDVEDDVAAVAVGEEVTNGIENEKIDGKVVEMEDEKKEE